MIETVLTFFTQHTILTRIVKVAFILVVTLIIAGVAKGVLKKAETRKKSESRTANQISGKLLKKILMVIIYIVGILAAIRQIPSLSGAVTTLLAGSGVLAVVIGFAAQESFGNLVSGVFLTIFKPFDVGDRVTLVSEDVSGYVEDITLRHTVIRTPMDTHLLIPNSTMGSAIVENVNYKNSSVAKNAITVDVAYDTDLDFALKVMADAIASHPLYAGSLPPTVFVQDFGASGITLRGIMATAKASDISTASGTARVLIKKAFDANGIGIPFQTITIANHAKSETVPVQLVSDK